MFVLFFCLTFFRNFYYILNLLIILEAMMLSLIMFNFCLNLIYSSEFLMLILLTFAACEAALGLSILVSFLRVRGNNFLSSITSTNWFAKNTCCWKDIFFTYPDKYLYLVKWGFYSSDTTSYTNFNGFFFINTLYVSYY
uniref:NADH-ubiquinone oxidoreductase chain 4L n=1 Tax=Radix sp. MOTU3 TaxID=1566018 RepID=A0A0C4ZQ69_9GAST|nr:NADH dehydrogenase subunit 4L [Radix sp. MOTU3]